MRRLHPGDELHAFTLLARPGFHAVKRQLAELLTGGGWIKNAGHGCLSINLNPISCLVVALTEPMCQLGGVVACCIVGLR